MEQPLWITFVSFCLLWHSAVSQTIASDFKCPNPGEVPALYPDPTSCGHFYQCAHVGTPLEISTRLPCPRGLSFSTDAKVCDWPFNVHCDDGVRPTTQAPSTEEPDGSGDGGIVVTPDDTNNSPIGGTTDMKEGVSSEIEVEYIPVTTRRSSTSRVTDISTTTTTAAAVTTDSDEPFKCPPGSSDKLFRDHNECRSYFQCAHVGTSYERAYKLRCPSGLVFNEDKQYCDWRRNVPECNLKSRNIARKR